MTSICLSTTPLRAADNSLRHVVDSLRTQEPPPTNIILSVPRVITRPGARTVRLSPHALDWANGTQYSNLIVKKIDHHDLGPATKLVGCLSSASSSCIVVTDDDAPRPAWWARALCASVASSRAALVAGAVGGRRGSFDPSLHLQGNRGFALRREAVDADELRSFVLRHRAACGHVDDQLFTAYFRLSNATLAPLCRPRTTWAWSTPRGAAASAAAACDSYEDSELLAGGRYTEGAAPRSGLHHRATTSGREAVRRCYRATLGRDGHDSYEDAEVASRGPWRPWLAAGGVGVGVAVQLCMLGGWLWRRR